MENIYNTIFPGLKFTGAFLTPDLQLAFIIPILEESEMLRKIPRAGKLFVQIKNGHTYAANGTISFEGDTYEVSITVRPAGGYVMEINSWAERLASIFEVPKDFKIPHVFKGVDNECYSPGIMDICDLITSV